MAVFDNILSEIDKRLGLRDGGGLGYVEGRLPGLPALMSLSALPILDSIAACRRMFRFR